MDLGLAGAKAFVAASRSGLGGATAQQLSLEGVQVAINGRQADTLEPAAQSIQQASGQTVIALPGDVSQPDVAAQVVETAAQQLGGLDILVTNAGGPPAGRFADFEMADWESAYERLIAAAIQMIKTALPYLRQSDRAAILVNASVTLKQPADNLILSNVMRAGLAGLVKSLANELGPEGIRINAILPGWTETERVTELLNARVARTGSTLEAEREKRFVHIPLRRIGQPDEFGKVAAFLCSPAAGFIHGAMIPVEGGEIKSTM